MAVAPTGAIYKALEFDGVSSRTYGVYITGEAVYNAPERDVEMVTIPGRNGTYALDNGRFENIEVSYPAGIFADTEADFRQAISEFRNFLCSRKGYVRLQDEYNPDEYRLAVYKSGLEVDPAMLRAGEFTLVFDCKPQRFLTSGETAVSVDSGDTLTNPTLFEASPMIQVWGYGTVVVNGYTVELDNAVLGPVTIFNGDKPPLDVSVSVASPRYNIGDEIIIPASRRNDVLLSIDSNLDYSTYMLLGATNVSGGRVGRYDDRVNRKWGVEPQVILSEMQITSGVDSSKTDTLTCDVKYARQSSPQTEYTTTLTVNVTRTYNASNNTITWSFSSSDTGSKFGSPVLEECGCGDIIADSTVPITGNPTYIDCDLGEAYKIEGGEVVSLNTHIDLGSKLPILAVGENEITFDNTFTEVKVAPRWWKI